LRATPPAMNRTEAGPGRKVSVLLWGVLCIAGLGALGIALDQLLPGKNTGFYATLGVMVGVTVSTYLEAMEKQRPMWWTRIGALVVIWFLVLRIFFKT
jgi:hypothetical protein